MIQNTSIKKKIITNKNSYDAQFTKVCESILTQALAEARIIHLRSVRIGERLPLVDGQFFAHTTLLQIKRSLQSVRLLCRHKNYFEALTILRFLLERLGWACSVCNLPFDKVRKNKSPSIKVLNRLYPLAGPVYGVLSDWAHVHPDMILNLLDINEEPSVNIYFSGKSNLLFVCALYSTIISYGFGVTFEFVYMKRLRKFKYLVVNKKKSTVCHLQWEGGIMLRLIEILKSINKLDKLSDAPDDKIHVRMKGQPW